MRGGQKDRGTGDRMTRGHVYRRTGPETNGNPVSRGKREEKKFFFPNFLPGNG